MSFQKNSIATKKMAEMCAKSMQFKVNCQSLPKRLNSLCKVLRRDFLLLISAGKRNKQTNKQNKTKSKKVRYDIFLLAFN